MQKGRKKERKISAESEENKKRIEWIVVIIFPLKPMIWKKKFFFRLTPFHAASRKNFRCGCAMISIALVLGTVCGAQSGLECWWIFRLNCAAIFMIRDRRKTVAASESQTSVSASSVYVSLWMTLSRLWLSRHHQSDDWSIKMLTLHFPSRS